MTTKGNNNPSNRNGGGKSGNWEEKLELMRRKKLERSLGKDKPVEAAPATPEPQATHVVEPHAPKAEEDDGIGLISEGVDVESENRRLEMEVEEAVRSISIEDMASGGVADDGESFEGRMRRVEAETFIADDEQFDDGSAETAASSQPAVPESNQGAPLEARPATFASPADEAAANRSRMAANEADSASEPQSTESANAASQAKDGKDGKKVDELDALAMAKPIGRPKREDAPEEAQAPAASTTSATSGESDDNTGADSGETQAEATDSDAGAEGQDASMQEAKPARPRKIANVYEASISVPKDMKPKEPAQDAPKKGKDGQGDIQLGSFDEGEVKKSVFSFRTRPTMMGSFSQPVATLDAGFTKSANNDSTILKPGAPKLPQASGKRSEELDAKARLEAEERQKARNLAMARERARQLNRDVLKRPDWDKIMAEEEAKEQQEKKQKKPAKPKTETYTSIQDFQRKRFARIEAERKRREEEENQARILAEAEALEALRLEEEKKEAELRAKEEERIGKMLEEQIRGAMLEGSAEGSDEAADSGGSIQSIEPDNLETIAEEAAKIVTAKLAEEGDEMLEDMGAGSITITAAPQEEAGETTEAKDAKAEETEEGFRIPEGSFINGANDGVFMRPPLPPKDPVLTPEMERRLDFPAMIDDVEKMEEESKDESTGGLLFSDGVKIGDAEGGAQNEAASSEDIIESETRELHENQSTPVIEIRDGEVANVTTNGDGVQEAPGKAEDSGDVLAATLTGGDSEATTTAEKSKVEPAPEPEHRDEGKEQPARDAILPDAAQEQAGEVQEKDTDYAPKAAVAKRYFGANFSKTGKVSNDSPMSALEAALSRRPIGETSDGQSMGFSPVVDIGDFDEKRDEFAQIEDYKPETKEEEASKDDFAEIKDADAGSVEDLFGENKKDETFTSLDLATGKGKKDSAKRDSKSSRSGEPDPLMDWAGVKPRDGSRQAQIQEDLFGKKEPPKEEKKPEPEEEVSSFQFEEIKDGESIATESEPESTASFTETAKDEGSLGLSSLESLIEEVADELESREKEEFGESKEAEASEEAAKSEESTDEFESLKKVMDDVDAIMSSGPTKDEGEAEAEAESDADKAHAAKLDAPLDDESFAKLSGGAKPPKMGAPIDEDTLKKLGASEAESEIEESEPASDKDENEPASLEEAFKDEITEEASTKEEEASEEAAIEEIAKPVEPRERWKKSEGADDSESTQKSEARLSMDLLQSPQSEEVLGLFDDLKNALEHGDSLMDLKPHEEEKPEEKVEEKPAEAEEAKIEEKAEEKADEKVEEKTEEKASEAEEAKVEETTEEKSSETEEAKTEDKVEEKAEEAEEIKVEEKTDEEPASETKIEDAEGESKDDSASEEQAKEAKTITLTASFKLSEDDFKDEVDETESKDAESKTEDILEEQPEGAALLSDDTLSELENLIEKSEEAEAKAEEEKTSDEATLDISSEIEKSLQGLEAQDEDIPGNFTDDSATEEPEKKASGVIDIDDIKTMGQSLDESKKDAGVVDFGELGKDGQKPEDAKDDASGMAGELEALMKQMDDKSRDIFKEDKGPFADLEDLMAKEEAKKSDDSKAEENEKSGDETHADEAPADETTPKDFYAAPEKDIADADIVAESLSEAVEKADEDIPTIDENSSIANELDSLIAQMDEAGAGAETPSTMEEETGAADAREDEAAKVEEDATKAEEEKKKDDSFGGFGDLDKLIAQSEHDKVEEVDEGGQFDDLMEGSKLDMDLAKAAHDKEKSAEKKKGFFDAPSKSGFEGLGDALDDDLFKELESGLEEVSKGFDEEDKAKEEPAQENSLVAGLGDLGDISDIDDDLAIFEKNLELKKKEEEAQEPEPKEESPKESAPKGGFGAFDNLDDLEALDRQIMSGEVKNETPIAPIDEEAYKSLLTDKAIEEASTYEASDPIDESLIGVIPEGGHAFKLEGGGVPKSATSLFGDIGGDSDSPKGFDAIRDLDEELAELEALKASDDDVRKPEKKEPMGEAKVSFAAKMAEAARASEALKDKDESSDAKHEEKDGKEEKPFGFGGMNKKRRKINFADFGLDNELMAKAFGTDETPFEHEKEPTKQASSEIDDDLASLEAQMGLAPAETSNVSEEAGEAKTEEAKAEEKAGEKAEEKEEAKAEEKPKSKWGFDKNSILAELDAQLEEKKKIREAKKGQAKEGEDGERFVSNLDAFYEARRKRQEQEERRKKAIEEGKLSPDAKEYNFLQSVKDDSEIEAPKDVKPVEALYEIDKPKEIDKEELESQLESTEKLLDDKLGMDALDLDDSIDFSELEAGTLSPKKKKPRRDRGDTSDEIKEYQSRFSGKKDKKRSIIKDVLGGSAAKGSSQKVSSAPKDRSGLEVASGDIFQEIQSLDLSDTKAIDLDSTVALPVPNKVFNPFDERDELKFGSSKSGHFSSKDSFAKASAEENIDEDTLKDIEAMNELAEDLEILGDELDKVTNETKKIAKKRKEEEAIIENEESIGSVEDDFEQLLEEETRKEKEQKKILAELQSLDFSNLGTDAKDATPEEHDKRDEIRKLDDELDELELALKDVKSSYDDLDALEKSKDGQDKKTEKKSSGFGSFGAQRDKILGGSWMDRLKDSLSDDELREMGLEPEPKEPELTAEEKAKLAAEEEERTLRELEAQMAAMEDTETSEAEVEAESPAEPEEAKTEETADAEAESTDATEAAEVEAPESIEVAETQAEEKEDAKAGEEAESSKKSRKKSGKISDFTLEEFLGDEGEEDDLQIVDEIEAVRKEISEEEEEIRRLKAELEKEKKELEKRKRRLRAERAKREAELQRLREERELAAKTDEELLAEEESDPEFKEMEEFVDSTRNLFPEDEKIDEGEPLVVDETNALNEDEFRESLSKLGFESGKKDDSEEPVSDDILSDEISKSLENQGDSKFSLKRPGDDFAKEYDAIMHDDDSRTRVYDTSRKVLPPKDGKPQAGEAVGEGVEGQESDEKSALKDIPGLFEEPKEKFSDLVDAVINSGKNVKRKNAQELIDESNSHSFDINELHALDDMGELQGANKGDSAGISLDEMKNELAGMGQSSNADFKEANKAKDEEGDKVEDIAISEPEPTTEGEKEAETAAETETAVEAEAATETEPETEAKAGETEESDFAKSLDDELEALLRKAGVRGVENGEIDVSGAIEGEGLDERQPTSIGAMKIEIERDEDKSSLPSEEEIIKSTKDIASMEKELASDDSDDDKGDATTGARKGLKKAGKKMRLGSYKIKMKASDEKESGLKSKLTSLIASDRAQTRDEASQRAEQARREFQVIDDESEKVDSKMRELDKLMEERRLVAIKDGKIVESATIGSEEEIEEVLKSIKEKEATEKSPEAETEAKAEEAKAEESKAEETKTEAEVAEAQAGGKEEVEEAKTEEAKAEETKAETEAPEVQAETKEGDEEAKDESTSIKTEVLPGGKVIKKGKISLDEVGKYKKDDDVKPETEDVSNVVCDTSAKLAKMLSELPKEERKGVEGFQEPEEDTTQGIDMDALAALDDDFFDEEAEDAAQAAKAEEPKAEETKPEESKPEESKAEEPKPEETKAEESKPEEPKLEELANKDEVEATEAETKPEEKAELPKFEEPEDDTASGINMDALGDLDDDFGGMDESKPEPEIKEVPKEEAKAETKAPEEPKPEAKETEKSKAEERKPEPVQDEGNLFDESGLDPKDVEALRHARTILDEEDRKLLASYADDAGSTPGLTSSGLSLSSLGEGGDSFGETLDKEIESILNGPVGGVLDGESDGVKLASVEEVEDMVDEPLASQRKGEEPLPEIDNPEYQELQEIIDDNYQSIVDKTGSNKDGGGAERIIMKVETEELDKIRQSDIDLFESDPNEIERMRKERAEAHNVILGKNKKEVQDLHSAGLESRRQERITKGGLFDEDGDLANTKTGADLYCELVTSESGALVSATGEDGRSRGEDDSEKKAQVAAKMRGAEAKGSTRKEARNSPPFVKDFASSLLKAAKELEEHKIESSLSDEAFGRTFMVQPDEESTGEGIDEGIGTLDSTNPERKAKRLKKEEERKAREAQAEKERREAEVRSKADRKVKELAQELGKKFMGEDESNLSSVITETKVSPSGKRSVTISKRKLKQYLQRDLRKHLLDTATELIDANIAAQGEDAANKETAALIRKNIESEIGGMFDKMIESYSDELIRSLQDKFGPKNPRGRRRR